MASTNPAFVNGVPELVILRLLAGRAMYGYELVQAIRCETGGALTFGEGVVYPTLHALERAGHLRSKRRDSGGRSRVYYGLTAKGKRRLDRLSKQWAGVHEAVSRVLQGGGHVAPTP